MRLRTGGIPESAATPPRQVPLACLQPVSNVADPGSPGPAPTRAAHGCVRQSSHTHQLRDPSMAPARPGVAPTGAKVCSHGRQPVEPDQQHLKPRKGRVPAVSRQNSKQDDSVAGDAAKRSPQPSVAECSSCVGLAAGGDRRVPCSRRVSSVSMRLQTGGIPDSAATPPTPNSLLRASPCLRASARCHCPACSQCQALPSPPPKQAPQRPPHHAPSSFPSFSSVPPVLHPTRSPQRSPPLCGESSSPAQQKKPRGRTPWAVVTDNSQ